MASIKDGLLSPSNGELHFNRMTNCGTIMVDQDKLGVIILICPAYRNIKCT
ncbi:hypothetical protein DPMN_121138 [Dreissena polymorpha]|uniref:Uncharacterized protein n=1 Tax=Dreissena polymorpha TaxID=45954 RepID=A0A9D4GQ87_DREPO|nr:hypothetical protein DPMN_121138 [Dreissena polymorpha]